MKKLLVFSLFCSLAISTTHAQNWFAADQRWVFNLSGGFAGFDFDFEVYPVADTVIQGRACRKWAHNGQGPGYLQYRFAYGDGPRAYYFSTEMDSFVKIYDFSLPVGAKVEVPQLFEKFTYQIEAIDTVLAGNMTLARQRVVYIGPDGQPTNWRFDILENVGMVGRPFDANEPECSFVFLPDYQCGSVSDGFDLKFICFSSASGQFSPYSSTCSVVKVTNPEDNTFIISPNPATDYLHVKLNSTSELHAMTIASEMSGKKLRIWEGANALPQFSLQGLPPGVYFVEVQFLDGTRAVKKLVKM